MLPARVAPPAGSAEAQGPPAVWAAALPPRRSGALRFWPDTAAIAQMEVQKLRHDPLELLTRAVQPVLWLLVFGKVMAHTRIIPTGHVPYLEFLAPGVLAQSALFVSIFYGIAVIWDRDLGVLHKFLVSPASRPALVSGKGLAAGVRALAQGVIVYLVAAASGVHLRMTLSSLTEVLVFLLLGSALFTTFSLIIACLVKTRERFMGIGQILTMPLFFASSAIYPLSIMPGWLRDVARGNPLTYQVDALRGVMLPGGHAVYGLPTDAAILAGVLVVLVAVAAKLYPRMAV
jgi:ABC-2 type transport system permease protein